MASVTGDCKRDWGKENYIRSPKKVSRDLSISKGVLSTLQTAAPPVVKVTPGPVDPYDLFLQEAQKCRSDEWLRQCPRCQRPAKTDSLQERAICTNLQCTYDYCIKCRCPFHGSNDCPTAVGKKTKMESVGSKQSKRNLRRL